MCVSPWARSNALEPLRNSLVLNVISLDGELIGHLLSEPAMTNVYSAASARATWHLKSRTTWFLADFLMRNKGFIRE